MNNQEIIDNAPEGATHYDCDEYMRHVHDGFWEYFSKADGWNETKPEEETRSLADIKRIAELENQWISVEDRLPDEFGDCLVYGEGFMESDYWNSIINEFAFKDDVTHWMPLPEPPKEQY